MWPKDQLMLWYIDFSGICFVVRCVAKQIVSFGEGLCVGDRGYGREEQPNQQHKLRRVGIENHIGGGRLKRSCSLCMNRNW